MVVIARLKLDEPFFSMTPGAPLEVELKINGTEFQFSHIIERLKEEAERWSETKAAEILLEKANNLLTPAEEFTRQLGKHVKNEVRRLFPNINFEDRY